MLFLFPSEVDPFIFSAANVFAEEAYAFCTVRLPLRGQAGYTINN